MNNKGVCKIVIVTLTALVTMMGCYIVFKLWLYNSLLNGTFELKKEASNSSTALSEKVAKVKGIIDSSYLYEYDEDRLMDGAIEGMLTALDDPYAAYYNEQKFKTFYDQSEGEYVGIGIYITYDETAGMPIVLLPFENSPAEEAGIKTGDYISEVDGKNAADYTYEEMVDAIKGKEGTKAKLTIIRTNENGTLDTIDLEVLRKKIDISPIETQVFDNIGYIKLTSFDESSYKKFFNAYTTFMTNPKIKGLVLDLRDNPGGILQVCAKITDLLVPEGRIVYTIDKNGNEEVIESDEVQITVPFAVIVNGNSASASEILTAAVKDYGVGTIVGEKTYGKGVVQTLKPINDGTYLKFTTQEYFSPKGNKIHKDGITPDVEVELPEGLNSLYKIKRDEDTQLQKALEVVREKIQ